MKNNKLQKGFAIPILVIIISFALGLGGFLLYNANQKSKEAAELKQKQAMEMEKEEMMKKDQDSGMNKNDEAMTKDDKMMPDNGEMGDKMMMHYTGQVLAGKSALLLDFVKSDYDAALKSDKLIVLYFYASWCPICKAEFPKMQAVFNELTTDKVIGFRVNYNDDQTDKDEEALASQFGVAYQHTKVFVKNGQKILKSPEGWDDKRYDMEINKAISQ